MPCDLVDIVERVWARFYRRWPLLDADDAKQQATLTCLRRANQWNGAKSSAPTYFSMVARHAIQMLHDVEQTHRRRHPMSSNDEIGENVCLIDAVPDPNTRDAAEDCEMASALDSVLSLMPPLVRDLIASEGDKAARTAILNAAGITRQAGDKRLKRAKRIAQQLLAKHL